jgi:hypothetical protein
MPAAKRRESEYLSSATLIVLGTHLDPRDASAVLRMRPEHGEMQAPTFVQVNGDNVYFIMLSKLTWTVNGERHEMAASWIATETHATKGWRISSHSWAPISETVSKAP